MTAYLTVELAGILSLGMLSWKPVVCTPKLVFYELISLLISRVYDNSSKQRVMMKRISQSLLTELVKDYHSSCISNGQYTISPSFVDNFMKLVLWQFNRRLIILAHWTSFVQTMTNFRFQCTKYIFWSSTVPFHAILPLFLLYL